MVAARGTARQPRRADRKRLVVQSKKGAKDSFYKRLLQLETKRSGVREGVSPSQCDSQSQGEKEQKICSAGHGCIDGPLQDQGCCLPGQPVLLNRAIESGPADPREDGNRMTGPLKLPGCNSKRRQESLRSQ